ncbi:Calmodulin-like protein 12 [Durusdinium trenchii]|uniref:Calmodulin-like protein 12 n=1 Tax=Durusdinium trenchii TaxID=1381693 RepID=A0ABP0IUF0_9DINO
MLSSSTSPLRRLADILIRVEDLAFVLCWADEGGNVADIELPRLGLRFKANARGGLECLGFSGLCVACEDLSGLSSRVQQLLAQFGGAAMLLKGPDGELGVVCSALQRPRRPGGGPYPLEWVAPLVFDRSETTSSHTSPSTQKQKSGHYFFGIHPSHCYVSAQDLAAELYRLTCCWLMHRYDEVWRLRFETITMSGDVKIQYFGIDQFIRCIEQS